MILCIDIIEIIPNRLAKREMSNDDEIDTNPYELKLFQMFKSCDSYHNGLLDEYGLSNLCRLLELQDGGFSLISSLSPHFSKSLGITFDQFREALLQFLGTEVESKSLYSKENLESEQCLNTSERHEGICENTNNEASEVIAEKIMCIISEVPTSTYNDSIISVTRDEFESEGRCVSKRSDQIMRSSSQSDIYIIENEAYFQNVLSDNNLPKRSSSVPAQKSQSIKTSLEKLKVSSSNLAGSQDTRNHIDISFQLDVLSAADLIKIWDEAQIPNGKHLLTSLGIEESEINLKQLYKVFEDELRNLENDAYSTLTQALIALQSAELNVLRQKMRQYKEENKKLLSDNKDANRRAAMLAAEIDECHSSLEDRSKKELQLLEQRHSSVIRELNLKLSHEREKWGQQSHDVSLKIKSLEKERLELSTEMEQLRKENSELFVEIQKLQKENSLISKQNTSLKSILEGSDRHKEVENHLEGKNFKDEAKNILLDKLNYLKSENESIRDKNDELTLEVENLNEQLDRLKSKHLKRSLSSSNILGFTEKNGTELIGCTNLTDLGESPDLSVMAFETENLKFELSSKNNVTSKTNDLSRDMESLNEKFDKTNEFSKKNELLEQRCKDLEASLEQMQRAYEDCEEYWENKLSEERQLYEEEQSENDKKFTELMEKVREYEEQFKKDGRLSPIEEKCLLEQQYEALDAENSKISNELDQKLKEIECLKNENSDLRLRLGESVEILTGACELNDQIFSNRHSDSPSVTAIKYLWNQSTIQEPLLQSDLHNSQFTERSETNRKIADPHLELEKSSPKLMENTELSYLSPTKDSLFFPDNIPQVSDHNDCDSSSVASGKSFETQSTSSNRSIQQTHSISSQHSLRNSLKEELKRLKFFEISLKEQIHDLTLRRDGLVMELQQLHEAKPVLEKSYARTTHPSLLQRLNQSELKNRHMENVIRQQQQYAESLMQQTWQQYQTELNELQVTIEQQKHILSDHTHRLQGADIMIKDLYVENAHLASTVQRLEQQKSRDHFLHQQQRQCLNTMTGLP